MSKPVEYMNRVELRNKIASLGYVVYERSSEQIKIEGYAPMNYVEARRWLEETMRARAINSK